MKLYFACSDIHSFFSLWMEALTAKSFDINNDEHIIILCGDLFDRGSESIECYQFVKEMLDKNRLIYVRGNHEDLLLDCLNDVARRKTIGYHHVSNGTVKTIAQLANCSFYDVVDCTIPIDKFNNIFDNMHELIDKTVDYFQLGNTVFVHGWVPTTVNSEGHQIVHDNWRDGDWNEARWPNGMEMFKFKVTPPDVTTVVCGHWHTSYGHAKITKICSKEFSDDAIFEPFIQPGIVALDACTAYTQQVNVVTFDEEGNLL